MHDVTTNTGPVGTDATVSCVQHRFAYAGVRYAHGANPLPGSGATRRYYAHVYFCEKCCATRGQRCEGPEHSSYDKLAFDATPAASLEEACVPDYDRRYGR